MSSPASRFRIIESTLREGEQFANAFFTTQQKIRIATMLDAFGVDYLELSSPAASPASRDDCATIASLGLRARILTHTRCHPDDVKLAIETGVHGVDIVIGTSSQLRRFGHGKSIDEIIALARDVIPIAVEAGVEVRFSTEDSFRSDIADILRVYEAVAPLGIRRVGIADTVGIADPFRVAEVVRAVRGAIGPTLDIEFHGHNDTGCAVANAWAALHAGATHIDTTVLGIGERNGITPLGGIIARLYASEPELIRQRYRLPLLHDIDHAVARLCSIDVPFNSCITGFAAFTHKAGIHAKAVLNDPSAYEALRPEDFGLSRYIHVAHRLTGWNAVRARAEQLGLTLSDEQAKALTAEIKAAADVGHLTLDHVDAIIHRHVNAHAASPTLAPVAIATHTPSIPQPASPEPALIPG
ncbi:MAG: homocitrate synthase [Phycisphaeraceae bacterium]|nr:homocitrate synthase [Phycisphaeraceae bacterium]